MPLMPCAVASRWQVMLRSFAVIVLTIGLVGASPDMPATVDASPASAATPLPPGQTRAELITITPRGFEPSQITRPAGRALVVVVNKSEHPTTTLRLLAENGSVLGQVQMPRNRRRWSQFVTLVPGRYRIVDVNRPNVFCNIEVTQQPFNQ